MVLPDYIISLAEKGYKFFPCFKDTKAPAIDLGFYGAVNDAEALKQMFASGDYLIGFPTGNMNKGTIVIDVDINKGDDIRTVEELIQDAKDNFGPLPTNTFQVQTMSGGRHIYFKPQTGSTELRSLTKFIDPTLSIDIRANGGYVIFPDENDYIAYDCELDIDTFGEDFLEIPEWIVNHKKTATTYSEGPNVTLPAQEIIDIRSALTVLDADDRDLWVKYGHALKDTGAQACYGLWVEWSQSSDKFNPEEMQKKWATFKPNDITIATLIHDAQQLGWVTTYDNNQKEQQPAGNLEKINLILSGKEKMSYERNPFPKDLMEPPGLVGDIADYINNQSFRKQPILAIGAALTAVGALAGRKVQTENKNRTNLYTLNIGESGCGKDFSRKVIKEVFEYAGCFKLCQVEEIASDTAIITTLSQNESQVFLLDEIGRFLLSTQSYKNSHLFGIVTLMLKLYSSASEKYSGKIYADKDKQTILKQPNLCILGTTVPDTLYKSLTMENVVDGFLSRIIIFESEEEMPKIEQRKNLTLGPPRQLVEQVKALYNKLIVMNASGNIEQFGSPKPQVIPLTDVAKEILYNFNNFIDNFRLRLKKENRVNTTYNRAGQIAEQIALIIATGVNISNPVIDEEIMSYATKLTKHISDSTHYIVENFVADSEFHQALKETLKIVRDAGKISTTKLTKRIQKMPGRLRKDVINTLIQSGQVAEKVDGKGAAKTVNYYAI